MQELAWLIMKDVDLESAQCNQFFRIPFIELGPLITFEALKKVLGQIQICVKKRVQAALAICGFWYSQF